MFTRELMRQWGTGEHRGNQVTVEVGRGRDTAEQVDVVGLKRKGS